MASTWARQHFEDSVMRLPNLTVVPADAFPGDLCKVNGGVMIFTGYEWRAVSDMETACHKVQVD